MKNIYYIQIEDKNIEEGNSINTLAGLKDNLTNPIKNIVFTNHAEETKEKYEKTGISTVIYSNKQFGLTNVTDVVSTLEQFLLDKTDYLLVFEDSNLGNSLATRVAAKLDLPYVGHVEEIESHPNSFTVKRHIGKTKAIRITPLQNSAVITVLFNGIMNNVEKAAVDIEHWQLATEDKNIYIKNEDSNNDLAYAKIVVAGGKGLQNAEGFQPLQELANKLNASLAATKAVTDQGWVDKNKMVGISNLTVKPDVYYAFGIAGAVQHTAGMDKSKHVIAVNTDRSAPIFKLAQYGIIGDANQVIDGLLNLL
jgi:electron transfer flavoprotein alpha subunit